MSAAVGRAFDSEVFGDRTDEVRSARLEELRLILVEQEALTENLRERLEGVGIGPSQFVWPLRQGIKRIQREIAIEEVALKGAE